MRNNKKKSALRHQHLLVCIPNQCGPSWLFWLLFLKMLLKWEFDVKTLPGSWTAPTCPSESFPPFCCRWIPTPPPPGWSKASSCSLFGLVALMNSGRFSRIPFITIVQRFRKTNVLNKLLCKCFRSNKKKHHGIVRNPAYEILSHHFQSVLIY